MTPFRYFASLCAASLLGGGVAIYGYTHWVAPTTNSNYDSFEQQQKKYFAHYNASDTASITVPNGINFVQAAQRSRPCVVHIRTAYSVSKSSNPHSMNLEDLFGGGSSNGDNFHKFEDAPEEVTGSGVIIADNGYIATNYHVIENADEITVVLEDKRSFKAKVIGTDPSTDLALLKIEAQALPIIRYGNSDQLHIGEWVLAVGNPFDLTSTVTAGIVSAKGRNINVLRKSEAMAIESFIQTDAAVNPGNSGGALVNLRGELVGINTAIASRTGYYSGYSFAVPVAMVRKVMDDLLKYGEVQRALLGVTILDINAELAQEKGIKEIKGVYVAGISEHSAASDAHLKEGDIILKINDIAVNSSSELQEVVARYRPGDKVTVAYQRDGELKTTKVMLRNRMGDTRIQRREQISSVEIESLGATFQAASGNERTSLGIASGVKVVGITEGGKLAEAGIQDGFVITHIDKKAVATPQQVQRLTASQKGGLLIEGLYPDGKKAYYALGW